MAGAVLAGRTVAKGRNRRKPVVKQIRIYYEGNEQLKPGFHSFLAEIVTKARSRRIGFELIACDSTPLEDFQTALKKHPRAWNLLLRDRDVLDPSYGCG